MTSKKSFFDFYTFRHILKRYMGVGLLYFLITLISMPVALLMQLQSVLSNTYYSASYDADGVLITAEQNMMNAVRRTVESFFSFENVFFSFVLVMVAVATAVIVLSYMHFKAPTYFYHSLPVSRTAAFTSRVLAGIVIALAPLLVNLLFSMAVAAALGFPHFLFAGKIAFWLFCCLVSFLSIYAATVLAGVLCGNVITHLLLTAVFLFAPAYVHTVFLAYMEMFYKTFYRASRASLIFPELSPVIKIFNAAYQKGFTGAYLAWTLAFSAAFFVLALFLYRRRPSEGAGKAVSFFAARPFIKYPVVALITFGSALVFHSAGDRQGSSFWLFFGFLFTAAVSHAVIEIVYNASFRMLFKNVRGLFVYAALGILLLCVPIFDLTGYDVYLPKEEDVRSVALYLPSAETPFSQWYYRSGSEGLLEYDLKDPKILAASYDMMNSAVRALKEVRAANGQTEFSPSATAVPMPVGRYDAIADSTMVIKVTLKSGREVWRRYSSVGSDAFFTNYKTIFESEEYKKARYLAFSEQFARGDLSVLPVVEADIVRHLSPSELSQLLLNEPLSKEQASALRRALQSDILSFTFEQYKSEYPVYTIHSTGADPQEIVPPVAVYPSYKNTLSELSKLGLKKPIGFSPEKISSVYIEASPAAIAKWTGRPISAEKPYSYSSIEITDPGEIAEILENAVPAAVFQYSPLLSREDVYINVNSSASRYEKYGEYYGTGQYYFMFGRVPQIIIDRLTENFDKNPA